MFRSLHSYSDSLSRNLILSTDLICTIGTTRSLSRRARSLLLLRGLWRQALQFQSLPFASSGPSEQFSEVSVPACPSWVFLTRMLNTSMTTVYYTFFGPHYVLVPTQNKFWRLEAIRAVRCQSEIPEDCFTCLQCRSSLSSLAPKSTAASPLGVFFCGSPAAR